MNAVFNGIPFGMTASVDDGVMRYSAAVQHASAWVETVCLYPIFYLDDIVITGLEMPVSDARLAGIAECLAEGAMMLEMV